MSEDDGRTGPEAEPAPAPEPRPVPAPPPTEPASSGAIIGGIFLILFGLCLLLVGGGCTLFWLAVMADNRGGGSEGIPLLLLSVAVAAGGVFAITGGIRLCGGRRRQS